MDCIFCAIAAGEAEAEIVYQDERAVAFLDANPATDGHVLVVPRAHARGILDIEDEDAAAVMRAAARVARAIDGALAPEGFTLFQANEPAGWQDVFHLHVHVVPRWAGDRLVQPWSEALASGDRAQIARRIRSS